MQREPLRSVDGWVELSRGMDSARSPSIIERNAYALGVNITARGDFPGTRPKYLKRLLQFQSDQDRTDFETGNIQGATVYKPMDSSRSFHIVSISGRIWKVSNDYMVTELTSTDRNPSNIDRVYMIQAEQYLVIQNTLNYAFVFDGATLARNPDIPVGGPMAYGLGRLVVASRREFYVGDIYGGPTSILSFTEQSNIALGGTHVVGFPGNITGLAFIPILNSSTGQGALTIHTANGIESADIGQPRANWNNIQFEKVTYLPFGAVSQESIALVNSDVWYRSSDGIRSLNISIIDHDGSLTNTPQSGEVDALLDFDDNTLIKYTQAIVFDNRLLTTIAPSRFGQAIYFNGLSVLDLSLNSTLFNKQLPAYDGLWTGIKITKLIKGDYGNEVFRAFAYCLDPSNRNCLWEITSEVGDDNDTKRIECLLDSASYSFKNPREQKKLEGFETFAINIAGQVNFTLQYHPDQYPLWYDWKTWSVCASNPVCGPGGCDMIKPIRKQFRPRLYAGTPPVVCDPTTDRPSNLGYEFQVRIKWTGQASLKMGFLQTLQTEEVPTPPCLEEETCQSVAGCADSLFEYSSE